MCCGDYSAALGGDFAMVQFRADGRSSGGDEQIRPVRNPMFCPAYPLIFKASAMVNKGIPNRSIDSIGQITGAMYRTNTNFIAIIYFCAKLKFDIPT